jgi:glycopeptide antibiotics resistance protein
MERAPEIRAESYTRRIRIFFILYLALLLTVCFLPFNFFQPNMVSSAPGGAKFADPSTLYTKSAATGLEAMTDFTFLMRFAPENPGQSSWIMSYGVDFDKTNLLVGTYLNRLVVEVHRGKQKLKAGIPSVLGRGRPSWLAVVVAGEEMTVYVDGLKRERVRGNPSERGSWTGEYPLIAGSRGDGKYPWNGVIYRLAFVDYPVSEQSLAQPDSLLSSLEPIADYQFDRLDEREVQNLGIGDVGPLIIPESFVPFNRAILMHKEVWIPRPIWRDIALNILAFVPLGTLIALNRQHSRNLIMTLALALGVSFGLSLGIELLQSFLPRRWSTFTDVLTNTLGSILGVFLFHAEKSLGWVARVRGMFGKTVSRSADA